MRIRLALTLALAALWLPPALAAAQDGAETPDELAGDDFDEFGDPGGDADDASDADGAGDAPDPAGDAPGPAGAEDVTVPPPGVPAPGEGDTDRAAAPAEGERMRMLVIDAATFGIDAVVGRVASARMRRTGEEMGYQVLTGEQTVAAAQQLRMPYPPTPADLWRVSWIARAHRGAFARIWAHAGQYVIEITVASLDGAGPFFARGTAGSNDLREVVDRLLRSALPAPNVWSEESAQTGGQAAATTGPQPGDGPADELDDFDRRGEGADEVGEEEDEEPEAELRRWSLTLQTEGAIGASQEVFYNHLVGLRLDFRITRNIILGAYAAYANLNAREGRASNLLFMLQFENRIRISSDLDLTIPLRGAIGYLPFNGPVIRLAAGLNYAVSPDWEIGADILVPTFWILPDRTAVSLDIALEATLRF